MARLYWRECTLLLVTVVIIQILIEFRRSKDRVTKAEYYRPVLRVNVTDTRLLQQMTDVAVSLHKAQIHVRGTKTSNHLRHAIKVFDSVLSSIGLKPASLVNRKIIKPKSVCPEIFMGTTFGSSSLYNKGIESTNCSYAKPISHLVTIVVYIEDDNKSKANKIAMDFADSVLKLAKTGINSLIITKFKPLKQFPGKVKYIYSENATTNGFYWNKLISEVKTPYVLIARDVDILTEDARLERLVREIEMLQVPVAAGSVRYSNGHWDKGCYQSVYRNFTLRYLKGYDESLHDCLFCDYVDGPFVASVDTLKSIPFSEIKMEVGLFEDWFLQLNKKGLETVVCPDAMFHVRNKSERITRVESKWTAFMKKWDIYKVIPSIGEPVISKCEASHKKKHRRALHPCLLDTNTYGAKIIMDECAKAGIICEMDSGTLLGGVKLGGVLPWEVDVDMKFTTKNRTDVENLKEHLRQNGFKMTREDENGSFKMHYKGWRLETWSRDELHTRIALALGKTPTKVEFDGRWSLAARNPGLFTRNRYGPEIYKHDLHWSTKGKKDSWQPYKPGKFQPCDVPEGHGCLDSYNGDGNLQFRDPLP